MSTRSTGGAAVLEKTVVEGLVLLLWLLLWLLVVFLVLLWTEGETTFAGFGSEKDQPDTKSSLEALFL